MQQNDLISRTALMEEIGAIECSQPCDFCVATNCRIWQIIKTAPAVEAAPVVHGRWLNWKGEPIPPGDFRWSWTCSECKHALEFEESVTADEFESSYCPNCGAKMDG